MIPTLCKGCSRLCNSELHRVLNSGRFRFDSKLVLNKKKNLRFSKETQVKI
jgi:hypothetical protein